MENPNQGPALQGAQATAQRGKKSERPGSRGSLPLRAGRQLAQLSNLGKPSRLGVGKSGKPKAGKMDTLQLCSGLALEMREKHSCQANAIGHRASCAGCRPNSALAPERIW